MLEVNGLEKTLFDTTSRLFIRRASFSLTGISLTVEPGKCLAVLGPNGAGKTTAIYCIMGLIRKDTGDIIFNGKDIRSRKDQKFFLSKIGYCNGFSRIMFGCSVREFLTYYAAIYGTKNMNDRIDELIEIFNISHLSDKLIYSLSSGQRTIVNFARSIVHDPEILILDEPTAFTDPEVSGKIETTLTNLKESGTAVLITSHNMNEVKNIADNICFLKDGKVHKTFSTDRNSLNDHFGDTDLNSIWLKLASGEVI